MFLGRRGAKFSRLFVRFKQMWKVRAPATADQIAEAIVFWQAISPASSMAPISPSKPYGRMDSLASGRYQQNEQISTISAGPC